MALTKELNTSLTPGPFIPTNAVTFRITVINEGDVAAQNISIRDYIPLGLVLADPSWTLDGTTAVWNNAISSLPPGASASVNITFTIAHSFSGQSITNFAEIKGASNSLGLADVDSTPDNGFAGAGEDDLDNANINVMQPIFDLALSKEVSPTSPGPFEPGSTVVFRITIVNEGSLTAHDIQVGDYVPAGLILADSDWTQVGGLASRNALITSLPSGASAVVEIAFTVASEFNGSSIVNFAEILAASNVLGLNDIDSTPSNGASGPDEDDYDNATINILNCTDLDAGGDGLVRICPTCGSDFLPVDLFGALGGTPDTGGSWSNDSGANVSLVNPSSVNFAGVPEGTYIFTYTISSEPGCPTASASITVEINGISSYACNAQINVSFGTNCEILVVPDMILEGDDNCMDQLTVNLLAPNGASLGNTITQAQVGQVLIAEVLDPYCGFVCWGYVAVYDNFPPIITCPVQDVDLICVDKDSIFNNPASLAILGQPQITDECGLAHGITFQDVMLTTPDCADQQVNRIFTVTDPAGNSAQCTQQITIRKPTLNDVIAPAALVNIACDEDYPLAPNGNPSPSVAGFPMIQTYYGSYDINQAFCNVGAVYQDSPPIFICEGTTRIIRTWTILDWCAPAGASMLELMQVILVGDVEGPVVTCPTSGNNGGPLVYYTAPFACSASFQAPLPQVTDNCSSWRVDTYVIKDEVVPVTNQFGLVIGYDTVAVILQTIGPNASRQVTGLEVGCYRFRYKVTDDCNNFSVVECDFCVEDNIAPSAVCKDVLNISLGGQGYGRVYAQDVDGGSWDNCGIEQLQVRRLIAHDTLSCQPITPYYSAWADYVDFSCCDVGQMVTIELLVKDIYGNENTCWMQASIEDKVRPYCVAPANASILCTDVPIGFDFGDIIQLQGLFGSAEATDNCAVGLVEELPPILDVNTCGFGNIIRRFRAIDAAGNFSINTCQQSISILATHNYEIKFPKDIVTDCTVPEPDTLTYTELGCDLLAVSVIDEVFTPLPGASNPECYTIFRTWRVVNWCEYDGQSNAVIVGRNEDCDGTPGDEDVWVLRRPTGTYIDRDNNHANNNPAFGTKGFGCDGTTNPTGYWRTANSVGYWEYTQIIKVMDSAPPQLAFNVPDPFCSNDATVCLGAVQYPFTIAENCTPDALNVQVFLDLGANGTIDQELTGAGALTGAYPNYLIQGQFPLGSHAFIVQATDGCGNNMAAASMPFTVVDCAPPAATCIDGLALPLQLLPPETDIDGDGAYDLAGAGAWASDFIISAAADCSSDTLAFSINRVGEPADFNQKVLYFTCADTGTVAVEIYTWDSAYNPYAVQPDGSVGGPNYSVCQTYVIVQDPNGNCVPPLVGPMMAGLIAREDAMGVESVEVSLSGPMSMEMLTAVDGTYEFINLETGYDYTLAPYLNADHRNGVTTLDLIKIQQHLLGISLLGSPYKMIAADVNRSGQITTLDMIEIQQLILGVKQEFSNNTSWRFVAASYVFPVPSNPWFALFPEVINVNNLTFNMIANNFVAIKIGDVNNSSVTTSLQTIEERSFVGSFQLSVPEMHLKQGETVEVPFTANQIDAIGGYQFTLDFDPSALELLGVEYGIADEYSLGLHALREGYITASWYRQDDELLAVEGEDPVLFTLVFQAQRDSRMSELLHINSRRTLAEAYTPSYELLDIALHFKALTEQPAAAFRLYQNQPNPFATETNIGFELPEDGRAILSIFDVNGRLVKAYQGDFNRGYNELRIERKDLPATGLLYYRLQMGKLTATKKMVLLQ